MIWGNISRPVNGGNVLGGVPYKNKMGFKSRALVNQETKKAETKRHFKVERSWRSCVCAPSLVVLADRKGSEYPQSLD